MSEGLPCVFWVIVAYPFDKKMSLTINDFLVDYLLDFKRGAVGLFEHGKK